MRRIVTENDANGKSRIMHITDVPQGNIIWESSSENPLGHEPRDVPMLDFLPGGMKVIHLAQPPHSVMTEYLKQGVPGLDENGFHRTGTLDFLVLLEGEMSLELEDGSITRLEPGDIVVQRDTNHAWRNTGDKPNRCLGFINTPAKPLADH